MKGRLAAFNLFLAAATLLGCNYEEEDDKKPRASHPPLLEYLEDNSRFSALLGAIETAGMSEDLENRTSFTFLAPNNSAFAEIDFSEYSTARLRHMLATHLLEGKLREAEMRKNPEIQSVNLQVHSVQLTTSGTRVGPIAQLVEADIPVTGGLVHEISGVLLPDTDPPPDRRGSLAQLIGGLGTTSIFRDLLNGHDLNTTFENVLRSYTVFIPSDLAMGKLDPDYVDELFALAAARTVFLQTHTVAGSFTEEKLLEERTLTSLSGTNIEVRLVGNTLRLRSSDRGSLNDGLIINSYTTAQNGVVYIIDTPLRAR